MQKKTKMKSIRKILFILFIFQFNIIHSQNQFENRDQAFIVGYNFINDSYTSNYKFFNGDNWNFSNAFVLGHVISLNDYLNLQSQLSNNQYSKGKLVNDNFLRESGNVFSADIMLQFDISYFERDYRSLYFRYIKPFVTIGFGGTLVDEAISDITFKERFTYNYGIGGYFWFDSIDEANYMRKSDFVNNLGLISQISGKSSFQQNVYGNYIQITFGLIYRY